MKYYYKISGMTCTGCKTFIERKLNDLDQIKDAKVDLENQEAEINVKNNIELELLQKKITSKYNIKIRLLAFNNNFTTFILWK